MSGWMDDRRKRDSQITGNLMREVACRALQKLCVPSENSVTCTVMQTSARVTKA